MTFFESNDSNAVEVDGIRFEIVMPERVLRIPLKQSEAKTQVQFGVRITNNTATTHRFLLFYARPEFLQANKHKVSRFGPNAYRTETPELSDFQLVIPGENVTFLVEGYFHWSNNELKFVFLRKDGTYWWFGNFNPGTYWVQVIYENPYLAWKQMGFTGERIYLRPMYKDNL